MKPCQSLLRVQYEFSGSEDAANRVAAGVCMIVRMRVFMFVCKMINT
jgi:hypothetical protein